MDFVNSSCHPPPPTDKVTHVSFHSSKHIRDDAPIQENTKEHPSDIDGLEKNFVDKEVHLDTRSIKMEISENQPINGGSRDDPFYEILKADDFSSTFALLKKQLLNEGQEANKCIKLSAFHSPGGEDLTEQLIQFGPSKATQIKKAMVF